ncbi:MAG: 30S ribosomal protein S16 [Chlamydiae bacterium]|nr:30S ribosomal protein S16 [Chlamydiota bacterium]
MAVKIRLSRTGRRNCSKFRLIAADTRFPRDGRLIENLGSYDPHQVEDSLKAQFDKERVQYWVSVGAELTESVENIFKTRFPEVMEFIRNRRENQLKKKRED